jgi:hypothetical protein
MTLADPAVWIEHFRTGSRQLFRLLNEGQLIMHPFVIGELACGNLARRPITLEQLRRIPQVAVGSDEDAHNLLGSRRLWGSGLSWVDVHLLASVMISGCRLWTTDKALHGAAQRLGVKLGHV